MRSLSLLSLLALVACSDASAPAAPPPSPQARLVDAAATLTAAAAEVQRGGYRVIITLQQVDSQPPKVGVLIFPR